MIRTIHRGKPGQFAIATCSGCQMACLPSKSYVSDPAHSRRWVRFLALRRGWKFSTCGYYAYCPDCIPSE